MVAKQGYEPTIHSLSERAVTSGVLNINSGLTQAWVQILTLTSMLHASDGRVTSLSERQLLRKNG